MIDAETINCWKLNYGLDNRTPADAMQWWHDNDNGRAPAGAVAALGLCLDEVEALKATISHLRDENKAAWDAAEYNARRSRVAEAAIEKLREYAGHDAECRGQPGYDIPCSCGYDDLMKDLEETK